MYVMSMRRRYYQSRGKGWFGDSERKSAAARGIKTGNKREQARLAHMQVMEMQQSSPAPVQESVVSSSISEVESVVPTESSGSVFGSSDEGVGTVGKPVSFTTSTNGLFRPSPLLFARKRKVWR